MKKTLNGQRNQCPSCREYFNSNGAFDKHRSGTHGVDRHCLSTEAMEAKGMFKGADGFWRGAAMPTEVLQRIEGGEA